MKVMIEIDDPIYQHFASSAAVHGRSVGEEIAAFMQEHAPRRADRILDDLHRLHAELGFCVEAGEIEEILAEGRR